MSDLVGIPENRFLNEAHFRETAQIFSTRNKEQEFLLHYANMPMQYAAILMIFLDEKNVIFFYFLPKTLIVYIRGGSNEYPESMI